MLTREAYDTFNLDIHTLGKVNSSHTVIEVKIYVIYKNLKLKKASETLDN